LSEIESGKLSEGTMLPKEEDLCTKRGVSRITLREAMRRLVAEGRLERIPGRGTFVSKRKLEQRLNKYFSFTRWAAQNGVHAETRILRVENLRSTKHIAKHLGISQGERTTWVRRLRLGDGAPLMVEEIWVPKALCPGLDLKDLGNIPLNDILATDYGITLTRAVESIEPEVPGEDIRELLCMNKQALLFSVEHTAFRSNGRPAYFCKMRYRGDRVKFSVELTASSTSGIP